MPPPRLRPHVYRDDHLYVDEVTPDVLFYTGIAQIEAEVAINPPLEELISRGSNKLTAVSEDVGRFQVALEELGQLIGDRAEVTRSIVGFCEITAPDVDKGAMPCAGSVATLGSILQM